MRVAVIQFAGTNCEYDTQYAYEKLNAKVDLIWHKESTLPNKYDLVILPGGFSYGDALRSGAIARFSPIINAVSEHASKGGYVLGICNGFQILLESHLLPGAMKHNQNLHFISKFHHLKVVENDNHFLAQCQKGEILNIPIAHAEGNYYVEPEKLDRMYQNHQILLQYCDSNGEIANPNGSVDAIAGICNDRHNVFGLMPHPERAMEDLLGSSDGVKMLEGFLGG